jgi:hypothetical protein
MVDMLRRGFEMVYDEPSDRPSGGTGNPFGPITQRPRTTTPRPFANAFQRLSGDPDSMASLPTLQRESLGRRMVLTALKSDGTNLPSGFSDEIEQAEGPALGGLGKQRPTPSEPKFTKSGQATSRTEIPIPRNQLAEGTGRREPEPQLAMSDRPKPMDPEAQREIDDAKRQPGKILEFRMEQSRYWVLRNDHPGKFNIKNNNKFDGSAPWNRIHSLGVTAVRKYDAIIVREAKRKGVDPDLIRAIMYYENADGHYGGLSFAAESVGWAKSIFPMQIKPHVWGGMDGVTEEEMHKPEKNILASVELIKRIRDRIENPTAAKIGSIWTFTGMENVNEEGQQIQKVYDDKPWLR